MGKRRSSFCLTKPKKGTAGEWGDASRSLHEGGNFSWKNRKINLQGKRLKGNVKKSGKKGRRRINLENSSRKGGAVRGKSSLVSAKGI